MNHPNDFYENDFNIFPTRICVYFLTYLKAFDVFTFK